jgi:hypothetical protein
MLYVPLPVPTVSELVRPTEVALKIDEIDQKNRRGWSIVMQVVRKESPSPISWHAGGMVDGVVPWASGVRNVFI